MSLEPFSPIEPIAIEGAFGANYFGVPLYLGVFILEQVVLPIGEADKTI